MLKVPTHSFLKVARSVTRLGEFSPNGRLLYFGHYLRNKKRGPKVLGFFIPMYRLCINFGKNGLGNILGDFFSQTHLVTLVARVMPGSKPSSSL
jgi:hypothetical protein